MLTKDVGLQGPPGAEVKLASCVFPLPLYVLRLLHLPGGGATCGFCVLNTFNCVLTRGAPRTCTFRHTGRRTRDGPSVDPFQGTIRFKQPRARARASTAAGPHIFSSCGPESSEKTLGGRLLHFGATREKILSEIFLLGSCDHTLTEKFQPQSTGVT